MVAILLRELITSLGGESLTTLVYSRFVQLSLGDNNLGYTTNLQFIGSGILTMAALNGKFHATKHYHMLTGLVLAVAKESVS